MDILIKVDIKQAYGNTHVYVVSGQAEAISKLTGRKTVTQADIDALKELGFNFEQVTKAIKL